MSNPRLEVQGISGKNMAITIKRSIFDINEDPQYLISDGALNIDGIDCGISELQTGVSRNSLSSFKVEVKAQKDFNPTLFRYLKENSQRFHSQIVCGSNPFKVTTGDYRFAINKVALTHSIDSFTLFFEGMLCQHSPVYPEDFQH